MHNERLADIEKALPTLRPGDKPTYIRWCQEALADGGFDEEQRARWKAALAKLEEPKLGPLGLSAQM